MRILSLGVLLYAVPLYTTTQVINSPGLYRLAADIIGNDAPANSGIITITASHVILDLDGHTITQGTGVAGDVSGITCAAGVENVTIKNGTIRTISGIGILIEGSCSTITISEITCVDCAGGHITAAGSASSIINGISIERSTFTDTTSNTPSNLITLSYCNGATLSDITVENIIAPTATISAITLDRSTGGYFENCLITNLSAKSVSGFTCSNTIGCIFIACTAHNLTATGSGNSAYGFKVIDSNRVVQKGITASLIQTITPAADAYGIFWSNVLYCSLTDSLCEGIQGALQGFGMLATSIQESELNNNQFLNTTGTTLRRGLRVVSGTRNIFTKNISFRNGSTATEQIEGLSSGVTDLNTATGNISSIGSPWTNIRAF